MRQAHRWILGQERGDPLRWNAEKREEACHHCDNRACCNLAHLYVGDRSSNMADAAERGRMAQSKRTECPRGHPYDQVNTYWHPVSGRQCRACQRERAHRNRREAGVRPHALRRECPRGHPYDQENTYIHPGTGKRYCRACNAASRRKRR